MKIKTILSTVFLNWGKLCPHKHLLSLNCIHGLTSFVLPLHLWSTQYFKILFGLLHDLLEKKTTTTTKNKSNTSIHLHQELSFFLKKKTQFFFILHSYYKTATCLPEECPAVFSMKLTEKMKDTERKGIHANFL